MLLGRPLAYHERYQGPWGDNEGHENAGSVLGLAAEGEKLS